MVTTIGHHKKICKYNVQKDFYVIKLTFFLHVTSMQ